MPIKVQVGSSVEILMSPELLDFYSEIACKMFPEKNSCIDDVEFVGSGFECSITWGDSVKNRHLIYQMIVDRVGNINSDMLIIDLSDDRLSGDGLAYYSLIAIDEVLRGGFCDKVVIFTSDMPSQAETFIRRGDEGVPDSDVLIVSSDSHKILCGVVGRSHADTVKSLFDNYRNSLSLDYSKRLSSKCIRRHGHFQFADRLTGKLCCTDTSYLIWDSEEELAVLVERQLKALPPFDFIVFDCESSQDLKNACIAVASRMDIKVSRFNTLIEDKDRQADFRKLRHGVAIVDFVVSGTRVANILKTLEDLNIRIARRVYTAIGHAEVMAIPNTGNVVQALVIKPKNEIVEVEDCEQCANGVSKDRIVVEKSADINSYTMHKLIHSAGWGGEIEDEIPANRKGIKFLPRFDVILANAGDWLGYKVRRKLDEIELGPDVLLLYPEQQDSTILIDHIRGAQRLRYTSLAIPQGVLDLVAHAGGWQPAMGTEPGIEQQGWFSSLRNSKATSVIIVDVFRATGGSIARIKEILKILNKRCGGAVVLVDFNPGDHDDVRSLYAWPYYKHLGLPS